MLNADSSNRILCCGKANPVMTLRANNHIANDFTRVLSYVSLRGLSVIGLALVSSCNLIVGFKDVTLENDDGGTGSDAPGDGTVIDGPPDAPPIDAAIDGPPPPPPQIFAFVTDAGFTGNFGASPRQFTDVKCQDKYNLSFSALGCATANIHAVIQIDEAVDNIPRMDITFPIPQTSEIKRATDMTSISASWDAFVNPNLQLSAPVATVAGPLFFWTGRGIAANLSCNGWTSASSAVQGNAGDATKTNSHLTQANIACNNFDTRLLCVCWTD
jgi:hypothetical protein